MKDDRQRREASPSGWEEGTAETKEGVDLVGGGAIGVELDGRGRRLALETGWVVGRTGVKGRRRDVGADKADGATASGVLQAPGLARPAAAVYVSA